MSSLQFRRPARDRRRTRSLGNVAPPQPNRAIPKCDWHYFTAIVTAGLLCPATASTIGTSPPGVMPSGITARTW